MAATRVQFNKKGTLLMVTGVLKQNIHKASLGEILVYDCRGEDAGDVTSRIALKYGSCTSSLISFVPLQAS